MAKIKLSESQIEMLKQLEKSLPSKKVIKISEEQYTRIFESNDIKIPTKSQTASSKVSADFKRYTREIPDSSIKVETDLLGHPIGGSDTKDYTPQTEPENIATFKSFKETVNQAPVDVIDFASEIKTFLKALLTDPNDDSISAFWKEFNLTKSDLVKKMFAINMLDYDIIHGKRIIKILKKDFVNNIKKLYDEIVPKMEEGMLQLGNDIEVTETGDKINADYFKKQLRPSKEPKSSKKAIKNKILALRKAELDRRKSESGTIGEDNYPLGAANDPNAPWNRPDPVKLREPKSRPFTMVAYVGDEFSILKSGDKYFFFYVDSVDRSDYADYADREETFLGRDEDGFADVEYGDWDMSSEIVEDYVNDNYKHMSTGVGLEDYENGVDLVEIDSELASTLLSYSKDMKDKDKNTWINALSNINVAETTGASSSGSFVGPMGGEATELVNTPKKELDALIDEYDVADKETEAITKLKYKTLMHSSLGQFIIDNVLDKKETDDKLSYIISLKNSDGKISDSNLLYTFDKNTNEEKIFFNHEFMKLYNAYKLFDEIYKVVFNGIKRALRPKHVEEATTAASSGAYVQPKIWAKDKDNMRFGKKTMYPKGKIVDKTMDEGDNQTKTAYPNGGFVEFDDCTKLNNNKEAINGGCSTGAVDNVVKVKKGKGSVVSKDAVYYEVAKLTGRTIEEVKNLIELKKA